MSVVAGKKVVAYNLKLKKKDQPMKVSGVHKHLPREAGKKSRYRFSGTDAKTGDKMSLIVSEEMAKKAVKELKLKMREEQPKEKKVKKTKRSCQDVAAVSLIRCEERRAKSEAARKAKKALKKKSAKKATKKRSSKKKKSSKA